MVIKRYIKYAILFLIVVFFAPTGIEHLKTAIDVKTDRTEQATENITTRLENPNSFNRDYRISSSNLYTYYRLSDYESKIRTVYDNYGIQLYFIEYALDFTNPNETKNETFAEVKDWLTNEGIDPYGLYHIAAEYRIDYESPYYDEDYRYWDTEIGGYLIYGEEVDKWWNTDVQIAFEESSAKNEYRPNSYNDYEGFIKSMYGMKIKGCDSVTLDITDNASGDIFVFCLFTLVPIGLFCTVLIHDVRKNRKLKQQQEQEQKEVEHIRTIEILETPIKTLEEEYAEGLKDKYK